MKIKYKKGTPCPSHEYYQDVFGDKYAVSKERGFLVGTHSENISTHFNHPFKGKISNQEVLKNFGIYYSHPLKIKTSFRRIILRHLPYSWQKKIRYWFGEVIWQYIYNFLRT